jgi:hypothetical protein
MIVQYTYTLTKKYVADFKIAGSAVTNRKVFPDQIARLSDQKLTDFSYLLQLAASTIVERGNKSCPVFSCEFWDIFFSTQIIVLTIMW